MTPVPAAATAPERSEDEPSVALVTLGCARNDVDSEELAARLAGDGFRLVDAADEADAVLINTCGFVESAKKDSIDTVLDAARGDQTVVAVGCLAERYGDDLAAALPEADAVLGFDAYPDIAARLRGLLDGEPQPSHRPQDRRRLLPLTPTDRGGAPGVSVPGHRVAEPDLLPGQAPASGPPVVRRRLARGPVAPVKLASGCDRRCAFCAIPSFRGSFVSRPPADVLADARWLAADGVRELFCVSENTTSYGKDLGDLRLLERLLPELAAVDGVERVRLSYLQPAETRPGLLDVLCGTEGVAPYLDLSFQHASAPVLRRMRRFGDPERFLALLAEVRRRAPLAGIRSNVIVGFPGETEADVEVLADFLTAARLDVVGVFGYSDEDGTEAAGFDGKVSPAEVNDRAERVGRLVEELTAQRAEDRLGETVEVLVESVEGADEVGEAGQGSDRVVEGRAAHQGPDVDGSTRVVGAPSAVRVGELLAARVVASEGVDLVARHDGGRR